MNFIKNVIFSKNILNFLVIIVLTFITFAWTFLIFHKPFDIKIVLVVIVARIISSIFIFKDYSMSWRQATPKSFLIKSAVNIVAFCIYMPFFYNKIYIYFFVSELFFYLFLINFLMFSYSLYLNKSKKHKTKTLIIYGSSKAGQKLADEFKDSEYKLLYFVDDSIKTKNKSIDGIGVISTEKLKKVLKNKADLLVIAVSKEEKENLKNLYNSLEFAAKKIQILPTYEEILNSEKYSNFLKDVTIEDLLARKPKDLDKKVIREFLENKTVLITGAGGSIGSEICRQCELNGVKKLILVDNCEYNLYRIDEEMTINRKCYLVDVSKKEDIEIVFQKEKPQIVIHAAAYKHVPLCEENPKSAVINNIIGTKNVIDLSIKHNAENFILISTDKAVRPTNIMGATKRVCEIYAQNVPSKNTKISAVRFGNVLDSSGSVVPKFRKLIKQNKPLTVTHPEITRYFMLIPEACQLVLQAGSLAKNGEIFILDMGEPVKIVDLAKKMLKLYGKDENNIVFTGLRPGEKLYEELLLNEADKKTRFESIFVAKPIHFDFNELNKHIEKLINLYDKDDIIKALKDIVKEFNHNDLKE
ncbi:polysaccharide biosynthesis protein [Caminibacter pacificus]